MGHFELYLLKKSRLRAPLYITGCMENQSQTHKKGWQASLTLRFVREGPRTLARERVHIGPLRLLKTHHPEGEAVAHAIIVHPPAGIVAGDELAIAVRVDPGAHAVMTTPGAQKWYRSLTQARAEPARAETHLYVENDAVLEWLPMESMIYDGCVGVQHINFSVASGGKLLAWELQQWGRSARGETYTTGSFSQRIAIQHQDALAWTETMQLEGGGALLKSPTGLGGMPCVGTMMVVGLVSVKAPLEAVRATIASSGLAITCGASSPFLGGMIVKAVANEMEPLRTLFVQLREKVRPFLCARGAEGLRVWAT